MAAAAPANVDVPEVCSGVPPKAAQWPGTGQVPFRGFHAGSSSVSGLPSVLALRIASPGRQYWYPYLSVHDVATESPIAIPSHARRRTVALRDETVPRASTMFRTALNQSP